MKNKFIALFVTAILLLSAGVYMAAENEEVTIYIDGVKLECVKPPIVMFERN